MMKPMLPLTVVLMSLTLFACKPQVTSERPVSPQIKQIMNQSRYSTAKWGFYVKDLTDNKIIYRLNPNKMFIPASVSKLFGVSALLHSYGPEYVFQTPIYAVGKTDDKGVFTGNLVLVGKGDLTLGGRLTTDGKINYTGFDHSYASLDCYKGEILTSQDPLFAIKSFAKQIKASGIRSVSGNVLVDNRLFETVSPRGNTISPTMINENMLDIEVMPTKIGKMASLQWRPQVSQMRVVNQVVTGKPGEKSILSITSNGCGDQLTVTGTIAADRKKLVNVFSIQDPQKFAQNALVDALQAEGISVSPNPTVVNLLPDAKSYQSLKPVAVFVSPPLIETAKLIWKVSHNAGANMVPLLLASAQGKTTYQEGMELIGNFVTSTVHVNPNEISFLDAAGGDSNYVSCESVIKMLDYIYHLPPKAFEKNLYALPTLGVNGSLESVARQTSARGHVFAKTGTGIIPNALRGNFFMTAQSLAGYVQAKNGHWLAFMVVVNGAPMKEICDVTKVNDDLGMIAAKLYEGN